MDAAPRNDAVDKLLCNSLITLLCPAKETLARDLVIIHYTAS